MPTRDDFDQLLGRASFALKEMERGSRILLRQVEQKFDIERESTRKSGLVGESKIHQENYQTAVSLSQALVKGFPNPPEIPELLDVAELLWLGFARHHITGQGSGKAESIEVPFLVPFLGKGHLLVSGSVEDQRPLVQRVLLEAFRQVGLGELKVHLYDPKISGILGPFLKLNEELMGTFETASDRAGLETMFKDIRDDLEKTAGMIGDKDRTLSDHRRDTGFPEGTYRLLVIPEPPTEPTDDLTELFFRIASAGPRLGLAVILGGGSESSWIGRFDKKTLGVHVTTLAANRKMLTSGDIPNVRLTMEPMTESEVSRRLDNLIGSVRESSLPSIPFGELESGTPVWEGSSADGLEFAIGKAGTRVTSLRLGDSREQRHNILVTGAVGQGKSNLLQVIIHSLALRYSPQELTFYLLDFKEGVSFFPLAPSEASPDYLPHASVIALESEREFGLSVLKSLEGEFRRRAKLFRPHGDNILKYRTAQPDNPIPRIVVVIDEFHLLFEPMDETAEEAAEMLERVARLGRSYGVHLILASQTISGISALMSRESGIFSQFPTRLALKNSASESQATFQPGNDAAALLKFRGEAVVNLDYGMVDSNSTSLVAAAEDSELASIRKQWWLEAKNTHGPPRVFDGGQAVSVSRFEKDWNRITQHLSRGTSPSIILGEQIDISATPMSMVLEAEAGRNLAVIGSGVDPDAGQAGSGDLAIGVLQCAATSLAYQFEPGAAEFVSLDCLNDFAREANGYHLWLHFMKSRGFPVQTVEKADVAHYLSDFVENRLGKLGGAPRPLFILGFGLDRVPGMAESENYADTPAECLQKILKTGPPQSIHTLASWSSASALQDQLGFSAPSFLEGLLFLRTDRSSVQDFLGPFINWSVRPNRGLFADRTQLARPVTIKPCRPFHQSDFDSLLKN